jgi:hypothetical protein
MVSWTRIFDRKSLAAARLIGKSDSTKIEEERCYAPHCDSSILHAPNVCKYCDEYPDWQELRKTWRINFTNEYDTEKAPCPSTYFREVGNRDAWPGNTPEGWAV